MKTEKPYNDLFKPRIFIITQKDVDETKERLKRNNGQVSDTLTVSYEGKPVTIKFIPLNTQNFRGIEIMQ